MYSNLGKIITDEESLYGWKHLSNCHKQLPMDTLKKCISFDNSPICIKGIIVLDDDSFKYIFLNQNNEPISSARINIKTGPGAVILDKSIDRNIYPKFSNYQFSHYLIQFVYGSSIIQIGLDYLLQKCSMSKNFKKLLHECCSDKSWATSVFKKKEARMHILPHNKEFPKLMGYIDGKKLSYNPNWGLINVMDEDIKNYIDNPHMSYQLKIFNDLDGVTQYTAICDIRAIKGHTDTNQHIRRLSSGIYRGVDYFRRREVPFENVWEVGKQYKSSDTWFIKVTSLPKYLALSNDFEYKIMAIWILKALLSKI